MAHSLGNMVVSSMIQDYGLQVSKYLMCDSAVPSEAYCGQDDISIRVPQLLHPDWEAYPTNTWASNWHKHFRDIPGDDRKLLGWSARFPDVPAVAVNFYSSGGGSHLRADPKCSGLQSLSGEHHEYSLDVAARPRSSSNARHPSTCASNGGM